MKFPLLAFILNISVLFAGTAFAGTTTATFQPTSLTVGPFPSDALTVSAPNQLTGHQVNIPTTPCGPAFSGVVCGNTNQLNALDGFSVNPRTMVCFSAPVDPMTLQTGISLIALDHPGEVTSLNQLFYDPATNCAFAKPNAVLRQQSRYLLLVTDAVQDANGQKLKENQDFKNCLQRGTDSYCTALAAAVNTVHNPGNDHLVVASLFTTMSATTWLEKAHTFVSRSEPGILLPAGLIPAFSLSSLSKMTWFPDDSGTAGGQDIPLSVLQNVDSVMFGLFLSPNFINVSGPAIGTISDPPTRMPLEAPVPVPGVLSLIPAGFAPISFHVFLPPASKRPASGKGFPLVIYGHGLGDNQFGAPTYIASTLASQGFATLAMEIQGHGFGPRGYVQVTDKKGNNFVVATPGRGVALSTGPIGAEDGCIAPGAVGVRDCARQSAVDLSALVSVIRQTRGLGFVDPDRIYYIGQSFGALYGTLFHAVEPAVSSAVLNGDGGTSVDIARLAISGRPLGLEYLASVNPLLLNVPPAPPEDYFHDQFNDNYPYRDVAPLVNNVPGAPAIQAAFESADWIGMTGEALAFAPHLKTFPLTGVPTKRTLFQFGLGDLEVPNPTESAIVRAANGLSSTWLFRFDWASASQPELLGIGAPGLPLLPHRFLSNPTIFSVPAEQSIALAAQMQAAQFLSGVVNPDPNVFLTAPFSPDQELFQWSPPLPETLNFLQIPK
ncbi:MAG TPA: Ig-like domain-containing protein [Bryobacteraceae bacterium]|jgi:dienelactone hydrolase